MYYRFFFFTILICSALMSRGQNGLKAEYYNGQNFEELVEVRLESKIDKYWFDTPPVNGLQPSNCTVRWTGKIIPSESGTYSFSARVDDGIRVWIDDKMIINNWKLNDVGRSKAEVALIKGKEYDLKVEYFNAMLEAEITLLWNIPTNEKKSWFSKFFEDNYVVIDPQFFMLHKKDASLLIPNKDEHNNTIINKVKIPITQTKTEAVVNTPKSKKNSDKKPTEIATDPIIETSQQINTIPVDVTAPEVIERYKPKNILFERAKAHIVKESYAEIDRFAQFMVANPHLNVRIEGHTDPIGTESKNVVLSERRAYAIASQLVKKGVAPDRIIAKGLGGSNPLVKPQKGVYNPVNSRTEFIVIVKGEIGSVE